jgi:hypothetical protein
MAFIQPVQRLQAPPMPACAETHPYWPPRRALTNGLPRSVRARLPLKHSAAAACAASAAVARTTLPQPHTTEAQPARKLLRYGSMWAQMDTQAAIERAVMSGADPWMTRQATWIGSATARATTRAWRGYWWR